MSGTGAMSVTDGRVQVDADGTLPLADVQRLLATLRPYDRLDQPSLTLDP
jgi:hypothetical protein